MHDNPHDAPTRGAKDDASGAGLPAEDLERLRRHVSQPAAHLAPRGSVMGKLLLLGLLAVGTYGGYYGYCRFKVNQLEHAMSQQATDLRQALMHVDGGVVADDIRRVVNEMARRAGVEADQQALQVSIEPMNPASMARLPGITQTALGIAAKLRNHELPGWVVGFRGRFSGTFGIARRSFDLERFTHFEDVKREDP